MKLQRLLPQADLPSNSRSDTVQFQQFDQVGQAVSHLGAEMGNAATQIAQANYYGREHEDALAKKEQAAVDELNVQTGLSRFKTSASQIIANSEAQHRMQIEDGGKVPHGYFQDTLGQIDELRNSIGQDDTLSPLVRNTLNKELLRHQDTLIPELQKSQTTLNVERNEGHLAEVEKQLTDEAQMKTDVHAGVFVSQYENQIRRSVAAGFLSREKGIERIQKATTKIYSDRFERMIATDPEGAFRAVNSDLYKDRDMLNHVDPKIIQTFLAQHKTDAKNAAKDQATTLQDNLEATIDPLVRTGGISRKDVIAIRPNVKGETWQRWMNQLDTNDKRIQDAIDRRRKGEEANLKVERDELRKQFFDLHFNGKDIPHELQDIMREKLDGGEWKDVQKLMSDRRDQGGAGNPELLLKRKEMIKRNTDAFSPNDIARMTDLNVKQRLELYKEREGEIAFNRAADQDPHHFTKDPAYKFYEKQIEDRMGVIPLSPFTSGKDIQVVAKAQTEYRQTFERAYRKGQRITEQEADKMADDIAGRYRKLLTMPAAVVKSPPRYKTPTELNQAWAKGDITSRDEYVEQWEKIKAQIQMEQDKAINDAEKAKKYERKK